jgi:hypothetical protein
MLVAAGWLKIWTFGLPLTLVCIPIQVGLNRNIFREESFYRLFWRGEVEVHRWRNEGERTLSDSEIILMCERIFHASDLYSNRSIRT